MSEIASFRQKLRSFDFLLDDPAVSEIAINGPGNVWAAYRGSRFMRPVVVDGVTLPLIKSLAELIAAHTEQEVNAYTPILSGRIPMDMSDHVADSERGDYRVQCVLAPDPVVIAITAAVFHDAHPTLAFLQEGPHVCEDGAGHVWVAYYVVRASDQLLTRVPAHRDKLIVAISKFSS